MTRLKRWWRDTLERWAARYYEGPRPPGRLDEMVVFFAETNPRATRAEWVAFASAHARECYRSGYVRGYEHIERDSEFFRNVAPDEVARQLNADEFDWSPNILLTRGEDAVPDMAEPLATVVLQQLAAMAREESK